jgi:hypothetical protein
MAHITYYLMLGSLMSTELVRMWKETEYFWRDWGKLRKLQPGPDWGLNPDLPKMKQECHYLHRDDR